MTRLYFSICFCVCVSGTYVKAQVPRKSDMIQKIQSLNRSDNFLSTKAAFELYKKTRNATNSSATIPAGNPKTYTFIWPQMNDEDNTLFFEGPIPYLSSKTICLTTGIIDVQIPNCQAPGFYLLQLNASFQNYDHTEIKVSNYTNSMALPGQTTAVFLSPTQSQQANFVFGVNLVQGSNEIVIKCPENTWYFYSLKLSPLQ